MGAPPSLVKDQRGLAGSARRGLSLRWRTGLIIAVCGLVYLLGNGQVSLWDRDEPRYAQTSKQMLESGDWVVPHLLDKVRTAKPILVYWCEAAAMKLLGRSDEFAARLPSSLAMIGTLFVAAVCIGRGIGWRRGMWTTLILGSSGLVVAAAKMCITDSVLLLWITIAQICLYAIYAGRRELWIALVMWVAIALAVLTKGPVVVGVQGTTMIVLALFDTREWRRRRSWKEALGWWRFTRPAIGLVILLVIALPWFLLANHRSPGFLSRMFFHEVVDRAKSALEGHKGPPGYYFLSVWGTYFPWSVLLPMTAIIAWKNRRWPAIRFALAAVIGPWVMMECVQTKLAHYVLPCFPPMAFLTADAVVRCLRRRYPDLHHRLAWIVMGAWGVIVAAVGSLPWLAWHWFGPVHGWLLVATIGGSFIGMVYGAVVYILFRRGRPAQGAAAMAVGMWAVMAWLAGVYLPHAQFMRISPRVAAILREQGAVGPGDVVMIDYQEDSLYFYQGGTIRGEDEDYWDRVPQAKWAPWVVLTRDVWDGRTTDKVHTRHALAASVKQRFEIIGSVRGWAYADRGRIVEVLVARKR